MVYLIEKYEKLRALELEHEDSSKSSADDPDDEATPTQTPRLLNNIFGNFSSKSSQKKSPLPNMN